MTSGAIPNRQLFRAQEVCEIAQVQAYVLRSWEAEFPELGSAKTAKGQRVYRRRDVERVLLLKRLVFSEGLTLAGARKRLAQDGLLQPAPSDDDSPDDADVADLLDEEVRQHLREVRRGLQWVLGVLDGNGVAPEDFVLVAGPPAAPRKGSSQGRGQGAEGKGKVAGQSGAKGKKKATGAASSGSLARRKPTRTAKRR